MKKYNKKNIIDTLKKVGLKSGQIVYIDSELFKFGSLYEAKNKNHYYKIFFDSIYEIIGKNGTIATNSYTFQTLRYGKKFIYEKTKCTSGEFSDYIREKRGSLRSQHPVFSVTALGKHKKYLCSNNSSHNYGYNSPYQRFLELDGKVLNLATDPCFNPFLHVAEFLSGVPYFYNKLTKVNYYKNNKKVNSAFVIAGGVASNKKIRNTLKNLSIKKGFKPIFPPINLCSDNAAMIAWAGIEKFKLNLTDKLNFPARARWPLDENAPFMKGAGVKL